MGRTSKSRVALVLRPWSWWPSPLVGSFLFIAPRRRDVPARGEWRPPFIPMNPRSCGEHPRMRAGGRPEACRLSRRIETTDDGGAPRFRCRTLAPYPVAASDPVPAPRPRRGRNRVPRRAGRRQGVGCGEGRSGAQPTARGRPERRAARGRRATTPPPTTDTSAQWSDVLADGRPDTCRTLGQFTAFRAAPPHETIDESAVRPSGLPRAMCLV